MFEELGGEWELLKQGVQLLMILMSVEFVGDS